MFPLGQAPGRGVFPRRGVDFWKGHGRPVYPLRRRTKVSEGFKSLFHDAIRQN